MFAAQEGTAFVTGDGSNKPKGFLADTAVDDDSWSWGNLGYVASAVSGAFPASNPSDVLVDFIYAWKVVVWDKVFGLGTTDALSGDVAQWATVVLTAYFGGRSLEKVARILGRK